MKNLKWFLVFLYLYSWINTAGTPVPFVSTASAFFNIYSNGADTARMNFYIQSAYKYLEKENINVEIAEDYIDSAMMICQDNKIEIPPRLHMLRADFYSVRSDYTNAEEEANFARDRAKEAGDYLTMAKALLFLGRYYMRIGFYQQSMDNLNNAITLAKEKGLKGITLMSLDWQADLLNTVGDFKGQGNKLKMMIEAAKAEKDTSYLVSGLLKLGSLYSDTSIVWLPHVADSLLSKCVEIALIRKDTFYIAFASANLGWNYYLKKDFERAIGFYKQSLSYSIPSRQHGISGNSFGNLGTILRDIGKYDQALIYYDKSIQEAAKINDWYGLSWVYKDMSQLYLNIKDTAKAYINYVLYKQYNDSLIFSRNARGLADARIRYEADSHNKEVALLSLRLKNNRILNIGFTVVIILMIAIGWLIIRGSKIEAKRRISEMNQRISEMTQANLRQQMNPHFIFNTLNSIQYYMYQHDKLATNNYLTKFSSLMRKVLENSHYTSVSLRDELDALNLYLELECLRFKDKFEYKINIDEEIDPLLFKIPTMLIQPYVENSICHGLMPGERKGIINIDLKLVKDYILCTIEDNGIGREAAMERKNKNSGNHNSLGTRITNSRLDLVNTLYGTSMKTVYTDLKNEKGEPIGTRVEIHIPIIT